MEKQARRRQRIISGNHHALRSPSFVNDRRLPPNYSVPVKSQSSRLPPTLVIVAPVVMASNFGVRLSGDVSHDFSTPPLGDVVIPVGRRVWQRSAVLVPASEARQRAMRQTSPRRSAPPENIPASKSRRKRAPSRDRIDLAGREPSVPSRRTFCLLTNQAKCYKLHVR